MNFSKLLYEILPVLPKGNFFKCFNLKLSIFIFVTSDRYFKILKSYADKLNLKELSMGMSSDFEEAILHGSTFLRLGTAILGERNLS